LIAAILTNDRDMLAILLENGAIIDYRTKLGIVSTKSLYNSLGSNWISPIHVCANENKLIAMQVLSEFDNRL
jgi:hypothetical protein